MTTTRAPYVTGRTAVAGGASLLSKSRALKPEDCPAFTEGYGAWVYNQDRSVGARDWEAGLLSIMLGHGYGDVVRATEKALRAGITSLPLGHPLEQEVAAQLLVLSGCEGWAVRWLVTGSAACTAAVKVARAITGRDTVISVGYHGIDDWALAHTPPAWGVPEDVKSLTYTARFNDLDRIAVALEMQQEAFAAVIVETETTEAPTFGYLQGIRDLCTKYGAAMILDECIVAGRYPDFTGWKHYGVTPDLWVTSKCLANGLPLAAVVGKREWMRAFDLDFRPDYAETGIGPTYVSGTYHVPGISLAAARATLDVWKREGVGERLQWLGMGIKQRLAESGIYHSIPGVTVKGHAYRLALDYPDLTAKTFVLRKMLHKGHVLAASGVNLMHAHSEGDAEALCLAWHATLGELKQAMEDGTVAEQAGRPVVQMYRQS